jgi:hypothetical protein
LYTPKIVLQIIERLLAHLLSVDDAAGVEARVTNVWEARRNIPQYSNGLVNELPIIVFAVIPFAEECSRRIEPSIYPIRHTRRHRT